MSLSAGFVGPAKVTEHEMSPVFITTCFTVRPGESFWTVASVGQGAVIDTRAAILARHFHTGMPPFY